MEEITRDLTERAGCRKLEQHGRQIITLDGIAKEEVLLVINRSVNYIQGCKSVLFYIDTSQNSQPTTHTIDRVTCSDY